MSDEIERLIKRFKPMDLPSLPAVVARELALSQSPAPPRELEDLFSADVYLQAKVLGLYHRSEVAAVDRAPQAIIARLPRDQLGSLLHQTAIQLTYGGYDSLRSQFLKHFWRHSRLTGLIAQMLAGRVAGDGVDPGELRYAAFCGHFLNIGKLVLEQVFSDQYLGLLRQVGSGSDLLAAERDSFGLTHTDAGAALLAAWRVNNFCCDAVRYHHEDIAQILDATALVKIQWLANKLAADADNPELGVYADALFALSSAQVFEFRKKALLQTDSIAGGLGIRVASQQYLPLEDNDDRSIEQADRATMQYLREAVLTLGVIHSVRPHITTARVSTGVGGHALKRPLAEIITRLLGEYGFLLLRRESDALKPVAGTLAAEEMSQIVISCDPSRSCIAASCLGRENRIAPDSNSLAVIDRQIMALLGTDNLSCLPLPGVGNDAIGVLVIGVPRAETIIFNRRALLCQVLQQELSQLLTGSVAGSNSGNDYERRIRETIHEVNNPLGTIKNYLQVLGVKQDVDKETRAEIAFIKSEVDRVGSILDGLKQGPREGDEWTEFDLNALLIKIHRLFTGSLPDDTQITVELDLDEGVPMVCSVENKIRQVVTNLVKNAAEAVTHDGRITLKTSGNFYMGGNRYIQLCIKDDGPGMATPVLDNLFVPGQTTKGGQHAGFGLAIVKTLLDDIQAQVSCVTNSHGTEFSVLIPLQASV